MTHQMFSPVLKPSFDHLSLLSHNKNTITVLEASDNRDGGNPLPYLFSPYRNIRRDAGAKSILSPVLVVKLN